MASLVSTLYSNDTKIKMIEIEQGITQFKMQYYLGFKTLHWDSKSLGENGKLMQIYDDKKKFKWKRKTCVTTCWTFVFSIEGCKFFSFFFFNFKFNVIVVTFFSGILIVNIYGFFFKDDDNIYKCVQCCKIV